MSFVLAISAILVLSMVALGIVCVFKGVKGERVKTLLGLNVASLFSILLAATAFLVTKSAFAADDGTASEVADMTYKGLAYIGAALSTGMSTIGAGIAVAAAGSAAIGAISEDSAILGKTLIFVGLAEGIAIYGLIISIMILGAI